VKEELLLRQLIDQVAQKFVELRKGKGYTSYETFAFDYDLPRMQYWRIESGKTSITLKTLVKLLVIHNLTPEEFFSSLPKVTKAKK
jgi:transcriptional regulator with XRE-family HTH domain